MDLAKTIVNKKSWKVGSMGGSNQNNSDKKNPAKGGVWVDLAKK